MFEASTTTVGQGGRIVIPAAFREKLGLKEGDEVRIVLEKYGYRIVPVSLAWKQAQDFFSSHKKQGESLVDELIKQRRAEFKREREANA